MTTRRIAPPTSRFGIMTVLVAGGAVLALALASASPALRSRARGGSLTERQAAIAPLPALGIFARPQSAAERSAAAGGEVGAMLDPLPPTNPATLRFAILGAGPSQHRAFLVKALDGRVCAGLTSFTSGCIQGLPKEMPVDMTYGGESPTQGPIVWGIARDEVRGVDVVVNGQAYPAILGRNAYFFQAPVGKTADDLESVRVQLAGGSVVVEPIG